MKEQMKKFSEKCRQIFFYGGIGQQEYEEIAGEVAESNRSSLSIASLCLLLMFGGDEFQVWIPGITERKFLIPWLDELPKKVEAIETPDERVRLGTSIGVVISPKNGEQYQVLFENADAALYSAKDMGRNRYILCEDL